jgi:hypothetical protein
VNDAKTVEVINSLHNLEDNSFGTLLRQQELPLGDIIKQIFSSHELEHDEVVFTALEEVNQLNDVLVLTHLEHLDLPSLLEHFDWLHVGLSDRLDCHMVLVLLVLGKFDNTKLTLAQVCGQLIEVIYVLLANDFPNLLGPLLLNID